MSQLSSASPIKNDIVLGVDGKPKNKAFTNMFQEEIILTEKQKLRIDLVQNKSKMKKIIKSMTPSDLFTLFDEDDSGLISFEEFRKMLPYLDIIISDAKAFRYFRLCDSDGSGEIDFDEFKVALFICDPTSGNPVGYQPSSNLTPIDAFELFDEEKTGYIDEDEFRYAMEYLKVKINEEKLENLFHKYDYNYTGKIDYYEFRNIYLNVCDLRQELEDRGVEIPTLIIKKTMMNMLKEIFLEEELRERRAITEAIRFKQWILDIRECKKIIQRAEFRAYHELRSSLDLAGQVYVIGSGTYQQFAGPGYDKFETKKFKFEFFQKILDLWYDRIKPQSLIDRLRNQRIVEQQDSERDADRELSALAKISKMISNNKAMIDPYDEALQSPFLGLNVCLNTASLWGRRVHQVAISENVIFALADTGEVFSWGGNSYWWDEIQPDSIYQTKWRGDVTARSQLLLTTIDKELPPDVSLDYHNQKLVGDDLLVEMIKIVTKYFNVYEPPPNHNQRLIFLQREVLSKISYDQLKFSLECRGKNITEATKIGMVEMLYADILLEKKLLGERAHKAIRDIEVNIIGLKKKKKDDLAKKFQQKIDEMWAPLRDVQAENKAAEIAKELALEKEKQYEAASMYEQWRSRIYNKREDMSNIYTSRGNSLMIDIIGATPRAALPITPRGYQAALQIAAGSNHIGLIHKSGQLYTWGVGASGRLGLDLTQNGDPQSDTSKPCLVQALSERSVIRISCGYSHTGAIVSGYNKNELYMWGSTGAGKCGLGSIVNKEECYCSVPTRVLVGREDRSVKKISCGSAHTAVVTEAGLLYVFGCGDGGRLGIGIGNYETIYEPTLIEHMKHLKIASISCGNSTTIVSTEVIYEWIGDGSDDNERYRRLKGGEVYITGSRNVFGEQYDIFTKLLITPPDNSDDAPVCIKQVAAGFLHSVLVSSDGELYCWGHNKTGCCGAPLSIKFIEKPTPVSCFYNKPTNLALHKKTYQSTTYNMREGKYAVNGKKDGNGVNKSSSTQLESQPWLEVDLGNIATIDKVLIWNRTDEPRDKSEVRDLYTSRLFPCWVMIGRDPFDKGANVSALKENLRRSICKVKFTENKRVSTWRCPVKTQGRYIRIQLEKYNTLSIAEIEIYGYWGLTSGVGRISFASAGKDVTVAVIRPSTDPRDVELSYKKAVYADSLNSDILRQLETYTLEYDKYGRGELLNKKCPICKGQDKCESCIFYETFSNEILNMPPTINIRRRRVNSISQYLIEINKPPLKPIKVVESIRPNKLKLKLEYYFGKNYTNFNFFNLFKSSKNLNYITPKEALELDPNVIMTRLNIVQKLDDNKITIKENELKETMMKNNEEQSNNNTDKNNDNLNNEIVKDENLDDFFQDSVDENLFEHIEDGSELKYSKSNSSNSSSNNLHTNNNIKMKHSSSSIDDDNSNNVRKQSITHDSIGSSIVKHGYSKNKPMKVGDILPTGHKVKQAYPKSIAEEIGDKYKMNVEWEKKREDALKIRVAEEEKMKKMNLFGK